jgi:hypothetical protein
MRLLNLGGIISMLELKTYWFITHLTTTIMYNLQLFGEYHLLINHGLAIRGWYCICIYICVIDEYYYSIQYTVWESTKVIHTLNFCVGTGPLQGCGVSQTLMSASQQKFRVRQDTRVSKNLCARKQSVSNGVSMSLFWRLKGLPSTRTTTFGVRVLYWDGGMSWH